MDSFLGLYRSVRRITRPMILRKIELIFYLIFPAWSITSFTLPSVMDISKISCYIVGFFSLFYTAFLYFCRLKINVNFGLLIHSAAFLLFFCILVFEFGTFVIFTIGCFLFILCILGIAFLCGMGHKVAASAANEPPVNEAWAEPEVDYQANEDEQIENPVLEPHWQFEPGVNPPESSNDVSPEMLNNDIADPQILESNCVNPPDRSKDASTEMLIDDVADPEMQENVHVNPLERSKDDSTEMLINDVANPQIQENVHANSLDRSKDSSTEMLIDDVVDPQIQDNDHTNPDIQ